MHELSIAECILDAVRKELDAHPNARAAKVGVSIGELAGIDIDSLCFCFEAIVKGSDLDGLRLEAHAVEQRRRCRQCGLEFAVTDYMIACPGCAATEYTLLSGHELDLDYLEIETDGAITAEIESAE